MRSGYGQQSWHVLLMLYDAEQLAFLPLPGCPVWRFLFLNEQLSDCVF